MKIMLFDILLENWTKNLNSQTEKWYKISCDICHNFLFFSNMFCIFCLALVGFDTITVLWCCCCCFIVSALAVASLLHVFKDERTLFAIGKHRECVRSANYYIFIRYNRNTYRINVHCTHTHTHIYFIISYQYTLRNEACIKHLSLYYVWINAKAVIPCQLARYMPSSIDFALLLHS